MLDIERAIESDAAVHVLPQFHVRGPGGVLLEALPDCLPVAQRRLNAGQFLYRAGQPFHALYLVAGGILKTGMIAADGREQVTGFHMSGDLLGAESIGTAAHAGDAIALDSSLVLELPYPAVLEACARIPRLHARLTQALAAEIRSDRGWMLALGTLGAEQRVAAFLLDVAARHETLGFSARHFVLRMGRSDIGSFLALKHETVTRALKRLSEEGCIAVNWREVHILDANRLRAIAQGGTGRAGVSAGRGLRVRPRTAPRAGMVSAAA